MTATLNGRTFFGEGSSKQKAKFQLAVVALQGLGFGGELGDVAIKDFDSPNKRTNLWTFSPNSLQKSKVSRSFLGVVPKIIPNKSHKFQNLFLSEKIISDRINLSPA